MPDGLRVIDLGCHDGFIARWLIRQARAAGTPIARYDGVELHPAACAAAQERIRAEGVDGDVLPILAEDAPAAFDCAPGTIDPSGTVRGYDLVLAYEIIEHVTDVPAFLDACEALARPRGGTVILSTPDGTFGEGSNPHHLRVYRAVDLADLVRRRGRPENVESGRDGIVTAAYRPEARRGEVAIYTGPGWEPWSPFDIKTKGLGGSETAAVRVAEELDDAGWVVSVYGEVEPMMYRGVLFKHHSAFDPTERRDVVVSSRQPALFDRWVNAPERLLWVHDVDCGPQLTRERADRLTGVLCLSEWQERHLAATYPWLPAGKVRRIRNGVNLRYFQGPAPERRPRVMFTSSPDRGLDLLLDLWPEVHEAVPGAELAYCYTTVYDAVARAQPDVANLRRRITRKADALPGVTNLGALSQPDLAQAMRESVAWAHPSWASLLRAPFHETYCIGAVEARCAGLIRVASEWGALAERGIEIPVRPGCDLEDLAGDPGPAWRSAMIAGLIRALTAEELAAYCQAMPLPDEAEAGWGPVAAAIAGG